MYKLKTHKMIKFKNKIKIKILIFQILRFVNLKTKNENKGCLKHKKI